MPVLLTLVGAAGSTIVWFAGAAALFSSGVILRRPETVLIAFPYFALLGPLGGFVPFFAASFVVSDWLFVLLAGQLLVLSVLTKWRGVRPLPLLLFTCMAVSAVVAIASGSIRSTKPILYLLQLTIVYVYTRRFANTSADWNLMLNSWVTATFLGTAILLHAFWRGIPLIEFGLTAESSPLVQRDPSRLFQATYYYAGFHYALGISIVVLGLKALRARRTVSMLAAALGVAFLAFATFLMGNKTVLFGSLISAAGLSSLLAMRRPGSKLARRGLLGAACVVAVFWSVSYLDDDVGQVQVQMLRRSLLSAGSLVTRIEVWDTALRNWVAQPPQVLIGLGPDYFDLADPKLSEKFRVSSVTGLAEGTVDSGYIAYLLELGVIAFCIVIVLLLKSGRALWRQVALSERAKSPQTVALYVLGALCYVCLALVTQTLGYSKISWLPLQLMIIGLKHHRIRPASRRL